jgi:hypothetical protein
MNLRIKIAFFVQKKSKIKETTLPLIIALLYPYSLSLNLRHVFFMALRTFHLVTREN